IHDSPGTRMLAEQVIGRLREIGEVVAVFGDAENWRSSPEVRYRRLREDGRELELDEIRRQVSEWQDAYRIVFDVHSYLNRERAERLLELVDQAIYFVPAGAADLAIARMRAIDVQTRGWRDKISIAWLLEADSPVSPVVPNLRDVAARDFKISDVPIV